NVSGTVTVFPGGSGSSYVPLDNGNGWVTNSTNQAGAGGQFVFPVLSVGTSFSSLSSMSGNNTLTSNNTGGAAHNNCPPTILCNYIVRIIQDCTTHRTVNKYVMSQGAKFGATFSALRLIAFLIVPRSPP